MSKEHLDEDLKRRRKHNKDRGQVTRVLLFWPVVGAYLRAALLVVALLSPSAGIAQVARRFDNAASIGFMIGDIANLLLMIGLTLYIIAFTRRAVFLSNIKNHICDMPLRTAKRLEDLIRPLASEMGIDAEKIKYWLADEDGSKYPSVIESAKRIDLIIPLGFLKAMVSEPDTSKALIAHELAHVVQEDSRLLLSTTAYTRYLIRIILPLIVVVMAMNAMGYVALQKIHTQELQRIAVYDAEVKRREAQGELIIPDVQVTFRKISIPGEEQEAINAILINALSAVLYIIGFFALRKLRMAAEYTADEAAVLYAGAAGVVQYLSPMENRTTGAQLFSTHPSLFERRRNVETAISILRKPN